MTEHKQPKPKYRDTLRRLAAAHYGYVTTKSAVEAGVPAVELPKLSARGGLTRVAYGLYRVDDIEPTHYDKYAEALLRAGPGSYIYGDSVLELLQLGDVKARTIKVAVNWRTRQKLPSNIELVYPLKFGEKVAIYEGIRCQPVADALIYSRNVLSPEILLKATELAIERGLIEEVR